ncbi:26S proteasome regulatory subunit RPN13, putative [Hepatocystis sp. ex Piliocolobus tephrosceles]|nr:26S proteasome regulatory subunit RPN13, putative [Hepatocystis sp. ex Piliocolobus tephrosceles]
MDSPNICLEINAGKCIYDGKTVKPDNRKGKLVIYKVYDNLYNLQWINRENNKVEDDLILTKSVSFKKVESCKTGRVYLLRNKLREELFFYWMQDYDESKDEAFVKNLNSIIANDISKDVNNKRKYHPSSQASGISDFMFPKNKSSQNGDSNKAVSFNDIFRSEHISKLLEIPEALEELKKHMPEGYQNKHDILEMINNKSLKPHLKNFDMSLHSHLNFVLMSLNLPQQEGNINDPMEYIIESLEKKYEKEENK